MKIDPNLHWLLSYYRISEIGGALFFGQIARSLKPSPIQCDLTRHFADEAQHARYWTECLQRLSAEPLKLDQTYQNQYLAATGMPTNLMEILALTQVFENRVVTQYNLHAQSPNLPLAVRDTLERIMEDERWHLKWIREALLGMEDEFGREQIRDTLKRFTEADRDVYRQTIAEHRDRIGQLALAQR